MLGTQSGLDRVSVTDVSGPAAAVTVSVTHGVGRLVLSAVQLVAVVEDVVIRGVEAGFHAVPHHLAGSGRRLELLDLNAAQTLKLTTIFDCRGGKLLKKHHKLLVTFILKKVILVRRSTVDFRSCSRSLLLAGKWFCSEKGEFMSVQVGQSRKDQFTASASSADARMSPNQLILSFHRYFSYRLQDFCNLLLPQLQLNP